MGHQFDFTDEELTYLNIAMTWLWVESRKDIQRIDVEEYHGERGSAEHESVKIKALKDKIQDRLGQPTKPTLTENIAAWQKRELALDAKTDRRCGCGRPLDTLDPRCAVCRHDMP